MRDQHVECLECFAVRVRITDDVCGRCGYVGWASSAALSESERRLLREFPPAERRFGGSVLLAAAPAR